MQRPSRIRRNSAVATLVAILLAVLGFVVAPSATADINYDAGAAANAFDLTLANQSLPLGLVLEGEGPLAQARQTSLGTSDAFAAFPYPGDTASQLPGLVGGIIGLAVPPYPFAAQSSNGDRPVTRSYPGIELTAQSADNLTQSQAVAGSGASGATARAQVIHSASGAVSATSSGDANGLVVGDLLTISGAHSEASASRDENGNLTRDGHLSFAHLGVPGLKVTFRGQTVLAPDLSFRDGQFTITLPGLGSASYAVPAQTVLDGLEAVGIKAQYQAERKTKDGVVSPGLVLTTVLPAPPDNPAGISGKSTVTITFGLATASVSASVVPTGNSLAPDDSALTADRPVSAVPPLDTGISTSPAGLIGVPSVLPQDVGAPQEALPGSTEGLQLMRLGKAQNLSWLYLLFVASALLCFGSTTILRHLGVRVQWRS
jgi:hypothetical protein